MKKELLIILGMCVALAGIMLADHINKSRKEQLFEQMRKDTFMQPVAYEEGINAEREKGNWQK